MFAGRRNEQKRLDAIYGSGVFECVILHGRRRVGKTALLREFVAGKKSIFFSARETSSRENLAGFADVIDALRHEVPRNEPPIASFDDAFERLGALAVSERVVAVIDDYQFLIAAQRGISALICGQIDKNLKSGKLMLLICGTSEPVMEAETFGYNSPFHGRRTAQISLMPFTFFETRHIYTAFSPYDIAIVYGLTGGVPKYLELMDPEQTIEDNIRRNYLDASSFLFEEPGNILHREIRDPAYYNAILSAIAAGNAKNSEIASAVGLETSACTAYLKNLISLGFVGKYTPITEKAGKKTVYEIDDNMFRFWYRFVYGNISQIQSGAVDKIWRGVAREIPFFMGKVFRDICLQWLHQRNEAGRLPLKFAEIGRWWGVDPIWKTDALVPIVAYSDDSNALFADCEWSEEPMRVGALNSLFERSRLFRFSNRYIYLFSRSGFTDECKEMAGRIGANLVFFE